MVTLLTSTNLENEGRRADLRDEIFNRVLARLHLPGLPCLSWTVAEGRVAGLRQPVTRPTSSPLGGAVIRVVSRPVGIAAIAAVVVRAVVAHRPSVSGRAEDEVRRVVRGAFLLIDFTHVLRLLVESRDSG
jgi:hypothetical protein